MASATKASPFITRVNIACVSVNNELSRES
jgi:hypothetical protein